MFFTDNDLQEVGSVLGKAVYRVKQRLMALTADMRQLAMEGVVVWQRIWMAIMAIGRLYIMGMYGVFIMWRQEHHGYSIDDQAKWCARYTHCYLGVPILKRLGIEVEYRNIEWLTSCDPFVVTANHHSMIDVVLMLVVPNFLFVSKHLPWYLWPITMMGRRSRQCFVDRSSGGATQDLEAAYDRRKPANMIVFPEGTRQASHTTLGDFRRGGFVVASKFELPVFPVIIDGTANLFGDGSVGWYLRNFNGGKVVVTVGDPIFPTGHEEEDVSDIRDRVRIAMQRMLRTK